MSEWIGVYCTKSVASVRGADLLRALKLADFTTLAEGFGIPEEEVEPALKELRIENEAGPPFKRLDLCFRKGRVRPIRIERLDGPACAEQLRETREGGATVPLEGVTEIVNLEVGLTHVEGIGGLIAEEAAWWLGSQGAALIDFYGNAWFDGSTRSQRFP